MKMLLRYETEASDIYAKLKNIPRTGWVIRGVEHPETVYDHTVSLVQLANDLAQNFELTPAELDDLTHILEVHDWAEAIVGDEFIPNEDAHNYQTKKKLKAKREHEALQQLLDGKNYKKTVEKLFERYETSTDNIATLAKEIDKYQALELALAYEKEQGIPLFTEFYEYYKRDWPFAHPVILNRVEALRQQHAQASAADTV
jgi:5'-deoxynucleotidase YfbR-like HD superfamily hydrolase